MVAARLGSSLKFSALAVAGRLSEFAQLLFPLMITNSNDFGRQSSDPFTVRFSVSPTSVRSEADFEAAIRALHLVGLVA